MELEVTWGRAARVWWAYFWRNLLAIVGAVVVGAILGGILGMVLGAMGLSPSTIKIVVAPISIILGFGISIIPVKMILGKDFGAFRLVLVEKHNPAQPMVQGPTSPPSAEPRS